MDTNDEIIVSTKNLTKIFPGGVVALDSVSLDIYRGEILALLGENGSGKSTLVKILSGIYTQDSGEIWVKTNGKLSKVDFSSPLEAMRYGIAMVSQVPQLVDRLSVAENLVVTFASLKWSRINLFSRVSRVSRVFEEESKKFGINIDPSEKVFNLSYSQKQLIEIFRALVIGAKVLLLDEVLTYLPLTEKRKFYDLLLKLREEGKSIVLITHKLSEAFEISDRIAVMRNGKIVGVVKTGETNLHEVRSMMFGASAHQIAQKRIVVRREPGEEAIAVKDLYVEDDFGREVVKGASIIVRRGEVVGIAGVAGNGQRELIEAVVGLRKPTKGAVEIAGVNVSKVGARAVRALGVGFILDRPLEYGCSLDQSILENIAVVYSSGNGLLLNWSRLRSIAKKLIDEYQVVAPSEDASMKVLSGGNIMKVVVSKEIDSASHAIVAYNPTRALDEAAASYVRRKIRSKVENDRLAALVASEDLDELVMISDVIYVANGGKLYGPLDPEATSREEIERLMVM